MALSFAFDGVKRSCREFKKTSVGWRCKKFQKKLAHPVCPRGPLKGGGRSQNYIRKAGASSPTKCGGTATKRKTTKRRSRR